jgi:DNA-binding GntR family transcriptional regulator
MADEEMSLERLLQMLRRRQVRVARVEAVREGKVLWVRLEVEGDAVRAAGWLARLCDMEEVTHA